MRSLGLNAGASGDLQAHQTSPITPSWKQGLILLITASLTVMVVGILGPSLPAMQAHFQGTPGVDYLVPLTMTMPMLIMAACSVVVGELADRWGRKRMLVSCTVLYAIAGTAPLYLDSLVTILLSRCALGLLEAVLMTVSTTMIGDYYEGPQRERMMSLQTTMSASSAFVLNNLGGVIAEWGWRAPYAMFALSLLLAPLMAIYLWEPRTRASMTPEQFAEDSQSFRPRLLVFTCVLSTLLGIVFLTVPVHFGYLFEAIGVQSPAMVGMAYGINSLGVISGTLLFGWVLAPRLGVAHLLALGAGLAALGFVGMKIAVGYASLTFMGGLNGLGAGIILTTLVTWNMRQLPVSRRGLGTGAFQSCLFLGMFANPLLIVGVEKHLAGTRAGSIALEGLVLALLALVAWMAGGMRRQQVERPLAH
jgi:MFS family permease